MPTALYYYRESVKVLRGLLPTSLQCDRCTESNRRLPCRASDSLACAACHGQKVVCSRSGLRANGEIVLKTKPIARFNGAGFSIINRPDHEWTGVYDSILQATKYLIKYPVYVIHLDELLRRTSDCFLPGEHPSHFPPEAQNYLRDKPQSELDLLGTELRRLTVDLGPLATHAPTSRSNSPSRGRERAPTRARSPSASPLPPPRAKRGRARQQAFVQVPLVHHYHSVPPPLSRSEPSAQASLAAPPIAKSASSGAVPSSLSSPLPVNNVEAMLSKYLALGRSLNNNYSPADSQSPAPSHSQSLAPSQFQSPATSQVPSRASSTTSRKASRPGVRFQATQPPRSTSAVAHASVADGSSSSTTAVVTSESGPARHTRSNKRKHSDPKD